MTFSNFNPQSCLKVANFFSSKEEVRLHPNSSSCNFRWKELYILHFTRTVFINLKPKMFDYGGSGTSACIHLKLEVFNLTYNTLKVAYYN